EAVERRVGLKRNQLDPRAELPQTAAGSDKGAAGTEPGDEMREASARLLDDFRGGGVVVCLPVGVVVVLVRIEIPLRIVRIQLARCADCAVGALERIGEHELGAERAKNQLPLR